MESVFERLRALTPREVLKIVLACGLIHVAVYYAVGTRATEGRHVPVPQPDTLLYCQSARQIANGTPYVQTPGDKRSTGSTTHLYPVLLAGLYKLGAQGDALLTAGFVLNALFYLGFLAGWCCAVPRLIAAPEIRLLGLLLLASNGMLAFNALAQSDIGLIMCVSAWLFAAVLADRAGWTAALLALAPWCRPEGTVLAFLFAVAVAVRRTMSGPAWRGWLREGGPAAAGVVSAVAVFGWNAVLTGHAQYLSLHGKGFFAQHDFFAAVFRTATEVLRLLRELVMGLPPSSPRDFFLLPLGGALCAWIGVLARPWRRADVWKELWWLTACAASIGMVAVSGFQGTNMDRYLAWALPVWILYMAEGAGRVAAAIPRQAWRPLPAALLLAFQGLAACGVVSAYYSAATLTQQIYEFDKAAHKLLPADASIGCEMCVPAYAMPGRRFMHLSGFYSPDFLTTDPLLNIERLKNRPDLRFDYWSVVPECFILRYPALSVLQGQPETLALDQTSFKRALWGPLDEARFPRDAGVLARLRGWRLADRLDVGFDDDESRCRYTTYSRFHGAFYDPFAASSPVGGKNLCEVGRVVAGFDAFTCRLTPNRPAKLVMRTLGKAKALTFVGSSTWMADYTFQSPLKLALKVDDAEGAARSYAVSTNESAFSEIVLDIPGGAIRNAETRLTLFGDHLACAYWLYQPETDGAAEK